MPVVRPVSHSTTILCGIRPGWWDGWDYWIMDGAIEDAAVINRARLDDDRTLIDGR